MGELQNEFEALLNRLRSIPEVDQHFDTLIKTDMLGLVSVSLKRVGFSVNDDVVETNTSLPEMPLTFHLAVYQWISQTAKARNMSLRQFSKRIGLDQLGGIAGNYKRGFVYYGSREEVETFVKEKLEEVYPDQIIHHISRIPSLYQAVMRCAYAKNMEIPEYLRSIGYTYEVRRGGRPIGSRQLTEEQIGKRLLEMYPTKKIQNLASQNRSLYNTILNHIKFENVELKEFLKRYGFEYDVKRGRSVSSVPILDELAKAFPSKNVDSFQKHKSLYERLRRIAKNEGISMKQVLAKFGYSYRHPTDEKEELIIEKLRKLYPNRVVSKLTKHASLYQRASRHAKSRNIPLEKYIKSLGFKYEGANKVPASDIVTELKKLYPDKVVRGISNHPGLYENVRRQAEKRNLTISQYLRDVGFTYINPKQDVTVNITSILLKKYPNRKVNNLSKDKALYARIQKQAKSKGQNIKGYLATLGFTYL